jgi:microcystin-dependent protein
MENYVGDIKIFSSDAVPQDWIKCDGTLLSIATYRDTLYKILLNQYGGDESKGTFAVPDLRGVLPIGAGQKVAPDTGSRQPGEKTGMIAVALTVDQLPPHTHDLAASDMDIVSGFVANGVFAKTKTVDSDPTKEVPIRYYSPKGDSLLKMDDRTIGNPISAIGSTVTFGTPLPITQGVIGMVYCIALKGIFPTPG